MVWGKEYLFYVRMGISGRRFMEIIVEVFKIIKILWDLIFLFLGIYIIDYIFYLRGFCIFIFIIVLFIGVKIKLIYMFINRWLDNENVVYR